MSNYDEDWQTHIKNNGANYNGVESQNEIISLLAANVKSKTIPKSGKFFL
jgi:hypothetical protein